MFTRLTDTSKATIFTVLVLLMALAMAFLFRAMGVTPEDPVGLYMLTPALAALVMLLVITRDGFSKEGWKGLGLHRLGLRVWWIAIGVVFLTNLGATAIVWATPLASFVMPEGGLGNPLLQFLIAVVFLTLTFALGEELGWRGYLRILTGSVWPASLAHSVHNVAWGTLAALTATSSPVLVNEYLAGDNRILILMATAIVAVWLGSKVSREVGSGPEEPQPVEPQSRGASDEAPAV
jgi:uncharacterized protein